MPVDPKDPYGDLVKTPTAATPDVAAPAPASAAPAAGPAQAPTTPTANDLILQQLSQTGPRSADRIPGRPDSWWDMVPGTKYYGEPAQPGPQSNWDWLTKTYRPSAEDIATVYGNDWAYGLGPQALQAGGAAANAIQSATGRPYSPLPSGATADAARARIQTAEENLGPGNLPVAAAAMATQPLNYTPLGPGMMAERVAARYLPKASELAGEYLPSIAKYVPENLFPSMAKGGAFSGDLAATHTLGQGGTPEDAALAAAKAIPVGALLSGGASALPLGRSTPEEIVNKSAQASQAANEALSNIKVPSKDLGFKIAGQTDPSVLDVQGYRDWLESQGVKDAGAGFPPKAAGANANYTGPTHLYDEGDAGYRQWLKNTAVKNAALAPETNLPTAQQRMMDKINQQLSSPTAAGPLAAAQTAEAQAQWAQALRRMKSNVGLPGAAGDVRAQAATAAQNFPEGSPQNAALQNIARVQDPTGRAVPSWIRRAAVAGGGALGEVSGIPGGGAYGANIGSELGNLAEWAFKPRGVSPLIQQQINRAYPPMAGQPAPGPGGNEALQNALLRLYSGYQSQ